MKISYVCPTNCVRRPIAERAIMLSTKEYGFHDIKVVYPFSEKCDTSNWVPNQRIENDKENAEKKKVKCLPIRSYYFSSLRYNLPRLFSMLKGVREAFKADIVHLWEYWYPLSVFVIFYAFFTGQRKKLIMTTDGFVGYSYKPKDPFWLVPAFKIYTKTLGWLLFRMPGTLTTYGKSMFPYAKKAGVPMKKLLVQGTGVWGRKFYPEKETDKVKALRKEWKISKEDQVVLFVGMLSERKGIKTVIEVGKQILSGNDDVKVLIVGDAHAEERGLYESMVPTKLKQKIIFTGGQNDIPPFMQLADVLLLPSEGEGRPGVVMEAMAAGTAAVATNEGCTPDLIDLGKNGFLVRFGDIQGYVGAVKRVLQDPRKFGKAAREKSREFDWDVQIKKDLEIYQFIKEL